MAPLTSSFDALNPQVQQVAPGSTPNFKPAGEGLSFKSPLGEALKGLGDLVGTVTQGVDTIIKSNIEGDRQQVSTARDQMISDLEATYGTQAVSTLLRPGDLTPAMRGAGAPREAPTQTITGPQFPPPEISEIAPPGLTEPQKLPNDINDLPGRTNALYNARNDGHISETYYWGRLADIASDIRSRYPRGYRDYIDNKIQAITGKDPANAYVESLIRDINSNLGDKNKDRDMIVRQYFEKNLIARPGAKEMVNGLMSGRRTPAEGVDMLASIQREDDFMDQQTKRYKLSKDRNEFKADAAAVYANSVAPKIVNQLFRGLTSITGDGVPDISTPEALDRVVQEYRTGRKLDQKVGLTLGAQMDAWIQAADKALNADFQQKGVYVDMANDPDKIKKIKDLHLEPLRQIRDGFFKGDLSAVQQVVNMNTAAHNDFATKMVNDKDMSYNTLALKWLKETVGDQGAAVLLGRQAFAGLTNSFAQKSKAVFAQLMTPDSVATQLGEAKDYKSLVDGIEGIRDSARQIGYSEKHPQVKKTYEMLFKDIEDGLASKDVKPETKQNLVKSIFSPANFDVLREIAPDRPDPNNPGQTIPGYQTLFYRLTKPEIAETINNLGPGYRNLYLNWVQTAVRTNLFGKDIIRLGEFAKQSTRLEDSLYSLNWNTTTKNFEVKTNPPVNANANDGWQRMQRNTLPGVQETVASLNKGLSGMANVAKGMGLQGTDVDGFVLDQLVQAGVPGLDNIGQMPSKVRDAIMNAYAKEKFQAEQARTKRKIQEQQYTSPK